MEEEREGELLDALPHADLIGLRLAAQVLQHKAELAGRPRVALYFGQLEHSAQAQLAAQLTGIRAVVTGVQPTLDPAADGEDRRLLGEYLGLLAGNERLSTELRAVCRRLRAGHTE